MGAMGVLLVIIGLLAMLVAVLDAGGTLAVAFAVFSTGLLCIGFQAVATRLERIQSEIQSIIKTTDRTTEEKQHTKAIGKP